MASKKYSLLTLMLCFSLSGAFAQLAGPIDFMDSSKYSAKKMAQYNEWANGLPGAPFAPKPRDAWQLGIFGGYAGIFGDINTAPGWNVGVSARKSLGYTLSIRPSISYGKITGIGYENSTPRNNLSNPAQQRYITAQLPTYVHYYQTDVINPSLDLLASLNNIMFHRKQSNYNFYVLAGYSPISYETSIEALNSSGQAYNWNALGVNYDAKRKDIKDQVKKVVGDADFETKALTRSRRNNFDDGEPGKRQWRHSFNVGAGMERRLGDIVSISAEFKYTSPWSDDYVDGWVWESNYGKTANQDAFFFGNVSVNFNLGLKSRKKFLAEAGKDDGKDLGRFPGKRTAPLWQHNPLAYTYGELSNPTRMNMPKGWLEDSDSDGVPDQFDLEPNTPAGAPVDTRGRSLDTDGDGVPDYLDKEKITPTYCQPVNADGIGKCPDPACCKDRIVVQEPGCQIGSLPSVQFASGRASLSSSANAILDAAASQIKANPKCKICVVGYGGSSKREQQLSWDRVNSVINYLVERQGISRDRFVFKYGEAGDANTVDLQDCTGESGPNMVPAPHPQYRTTK